MQQAKPPSGTCRVERYKISKYSLKRFICKHASLSWCSLFYHVFFSAGNGLANLRNITLMKEYAQSFLSNCSTDSRPIFLCKSPRGLPYYSASTFSSSMTVQCTSYNITKYIILLCILSCILCPQPLTVSLNVRPVLQYLLSVTTSMRGIAKFVLKYYLTCSL